MKQYDAIVIGGGINSLGAAALLSQKEKSTLLLESTDTVGGMASSYEFTPGFKCNMVYDYIRWIDPHLIKLLNLQNYNLELLSPKPLRIALDKNGRHIEFHIDPDKTAASIAYHSMKDAQKWPEFTEYIKKLTNFLKPLYRMAPPNISDIGIKDGLSMSAMLNPMWRHGSRGLVDTMRTVPMMMSELLDEWFESELLRGSLAASGITHINQGPFSAATGLNFLHQHIHANGIIHSAHYIKGGTKQFAYALANTAEKMGAEIQTGSPVSYIDCKNGVCSGASTSDGQTYYANIVISGLDPTNTCIKLVGASKISPTFQRQLKNIKYRGSTARVQFALDKYPKIKGVSSDKMNTVFTINPSIEYLEQAYDDSKYGRISKNPYLEFTIPSNQNPDLSPKGKHVLSASIQYVPYQLRNKNWNNELKKQVIQNVISIMEKYIPEFTNSIESSAIMTPVDLENRFGLTEGSLNHGEMTLDQFYFMRPNIYFSQYSTPIQNLFLCGPGTHPGGGLHGANAVNAVREITKY